MNVSPVYHGAPAESRTPVEDRTYAALEELGIPFDRVDHDPAEDMADCAVISQALGADICKNLLLTPRNRSAFYLLAMPGDKPFVTKDLSKQIGSSRLSFATAEDLEQLLGVQPGSASVLGLLNDKEHRVIVVPSVKVLDGCIYIVGFVSGEGEISQMGRSLKKPFYVAYKVNTRQYIYVFW